MKQFIAYSIFIGIATASNFGYAQSIQPAPVAKFDTRYHSTDSKIVVFDDGNHTYVALPQGLTAPIVMSQVPAGEILLQPSQLSPYLLLAGLHKKIKLVWGNDRSVVITHTGSSSVERNGAAAAFGATAPLSVHGAIAKPVLAEIKKPLIDAVGQIESTVPPKVAPQKGGPQVDFVPEAPPSPLPLNALVEPKIASPLSKRLTIQTGQRLSIGLRDWLKSQQFELVWDVTAPGDRIRDIEMISSWSSPTDDLDKTLSLLLPNFGLRAIVQTDPHTVIVRVATGSTSKTTGAQSK